MSWNKIIVVILIASIVGCVHEINVNYLQKQTKLLSNEEDLHSLIALDALYNKINLPLAKGIFEELYQKSNNPEYLLEYLKILALQKDPNFQTSALKYKNKFQTKHEQIDDLLLEFYLNNAEYDKAKLKIKEILKSTKDESKKEKMLEILEKIEDLNKAKQIYDQAQTMLKIGTLEDAIKILDQYSLLHVKDKRVYLLLADLYIKSNQPIKAGEVLLQAYRVLNDKKLAEESIKIFIKANAFEKATYVLELSELDDYLLMELYGYIKKYNKAFNLAKKLYEKDKNPDLLSSMAIYKYEGAKIKSKSLLHEVSELFEQALMERQDAQSLNYYGYLLIDHDLDIKRGMSFVKLALDKNPTSVYYLDSLAWGYYKLNQCQKAYEIIFPLSQKNELEEIKIHTKMILKCLKKDK